MLFWEQRRIQGLAPPPLNTEMYGKLGLILNILLNWWMKVPPWYLDEYIEYPVELVDEGGPRPHSPGLRRRAVEHVPGLT